MKKVYIIAEAGVNHNGSIEMAKSLIDVAAGAGADAVKFQTFKAEKLVSASAPKADYQLQSTDRAESQYQMIKRLELDAEAHVALAAHCSARGIQFLSSPFDEESVRFLVEEMQVPYVKIPSGEIVNGPYLMAIAKLNAPVILSTGMSTLAEVREALAVLAYGYCGSPGAPSRVAFARAYESKAGREALARKVVLLHCTTEYPAAFNELNLRAIDTMAAEFGLPVGLSDHTPGVWAPIAAVARGAVMIEKHFTLDCGLPGPDHRASLEPKELREMVQAIRAIESALGTGTKAPSPAELKNMKVVRKSLTAARKLAKGDVFSVDNLKAVRPGNGISPMRYWECLGQAARRDYEAGEAIECGGFSEFTDG